MKESTRKVIESIISDMIGLLAALPLILQSINVNTAVGWGAALVGVSAVVVRLLAVPQVRRALDHLLGSDPVE
jgi:hypothetical protein